jgi:hypothetical protein
LRGTCYHTVRDAIETTPSRLKNGCLNLVSRAGLEPATLCLKGSSDGFCSLLKT